MDKHIKSISSSDYNNKTISSSDYNNKIISSSDYNNKTIDNINHLNIIDEIYTKSKSDYKAFLISDPYASGTWYYYDDRLIRIYSDYNYNIKQIGSLFMAKPNNSLFFIMENNMTVSFISITKEKITIKINDLLVNYSLSKVSWVEPKYSEQKINWTD